MNITTQKLYNLFKVSGRKLAGQHCGGGGFGDGVATYADAIQAATGHYPALIGGLCSFYWDKSYTDKLIAHSKAGGVVCVSYSPDGLFTGPASMTNAVLPGTAENGKLINGVASSTQTIMGLKGLKAVLTDLQAADVPVLLRPWQEANGVGWNWWCGGTQEQYFGLWNYFRDYMAGLDNIILVFSPNYVYNSSEVGPVLYYYPGQTRCDVVALDIYTPDSLSGVRAGGWNDLISTGLPVAIGEFGPGGGRNEPAKNSYDWSYFVSQVKNYLPEAAWLMVWNSTYGVPSQKNPDAFMSAFVDREQLKTLLAGQVTPTPTPPPPLPTASISASVTKWLWWRYVTLIWSTKNATSVSINNGIGVVTASGSKSIWTSPTTFTITAVNAEGKKAQASVKVA
jgi:hypothetical protein